MEVGAALVGAVVADEPGTELLLAALDDAAVDASGFAVIELLFAFVSVAANDAEFPPFPTTAPDLVDLELLSTGFLCASRRAFASANFFCASRSFGRMTRGGDSLSFSPLPGHHLLAKPFDLRFFSFPDRSSRS